MEKPLNSALASSQMHRDAPNDLICKDLGITTIGNLADVPPAVRTLDLSYNPLASLGGIDQFPQLRQFTAYGCRLKEVDGLSALKKIEKLHIQQNVIKRFSEGFKQLSKLRDLRIDRNRLTTIENLGSCISLRILNISYNQITNLDGLAGLQNLSELKVNNNAIRSLRPLKGLPSLREIDCSYNSLKSLDGLQFLVVIEVVRAEHNQIVTLQLGADVADDKPSASIRRSTSQASDASAVSVQANRLSEMTSALKQSRSRGSSVSLSDNAAAASKAKSTRPKAVEEKKLGVIELHLRGNRLKNLERLETFGPNVEVLDISSNNITGDGRSLAAQVRHLDKLAEIRVEGNPGLTGGGSEEGSVCDDIHCELISMCPSLQNIDTCAVVDGRVVSSNGGAVDGSRKEDDASLRLVKDIETSLNIHHSPGPQSEVLNADGTISHTWLNRGEGSTVLDENASMAIDQQSDDEQSIASSHDENTKKQREEDVAAAEKLAGLNVDKSMLSEEQIAEIEGSFTNLLLACRERLAALPRPPTKEEDEYGTDIDIGQLSSVYTDLGGRNTSSQPIVTDLGRRTSDILAKHGAISGMMSPVMPPRPQNEIIREVKTQPKSPSKKHKPPKAPLLPPTATDMPDVVQEEGVLTTASSLVTNVVMYTTEGTPATAANELPRGGSLKDINVDAYARKEGLTDA